MSDPIRVKGAKLIPEPLPTDIAPFGSWLCRRPTCRTMVAKKARVGRPPRCPGCGNVSMERHPHERRAPRPTAVTSTRSPAPPGITELTGDSTLLRGDSPMEWWDPANECPHGRVPAESCGPCGRAGVPHPGWATLARTERRRGRPAIAPTLF